LFVNQQFAYNKYLRNILCFLLHVSAVDRLLQEAKTTTFVIYIKPNVSQIMYMYVYVSKRNMLQEYHCFLWCP